MPIEFRPIQEPPLSLDTTKLEAALRRAMTDFVAESRRTFVRYPPKSGRSRYRRTGDLRRSWSQRVTRQGDAIVGVLSSNAAIAPYNVKVQGPRRGSTTKTTQVPSLRLKGWQSVPDEMVGLWRRKYRSRFMEIVRLLRR